MNRALILREKVTRLVPMLSQRRIKVHQRGTQAYVRYDERGTPLLVNIPYIPENATDLFMDAIEGFLDHEVGHLLFTESTLVHKARKAGVFGTFNVLEDTFIEREMCKRFPGSAYNLARVGNFYCESLAPEMLKNATTEEKLISVLMVPAMRAWAGQAVFADFMRDKWHLMGKVLERAKDLIPLVPLITSTEESLELAKKFRKAIQSPPPPKSEGGERCEKGDKGDSKDPPPDQESAENPGAGDTAEDDASDETPSPSDPSEEEAETDDESGTEDDDADDDDHSEVGESAPEETDPADRDDSDDAGTDPSDEDAEDEEGADDPVVGDEGDSGESGDDSDAGGESDEEDDDDADSTAGDGADRTDPETSESDESLGGERAGEGGDDDAEERDRVEDEPTEEDPEEAEPGRGAPSEELPPDMSYDEVDAAIPDYDNTVSEAISEEAVEIAKSSDYIIYSTDYDKIEPWDGSATSSRELKELQDKVDHMLGSMQKDLERAIAARSRVMLTPGYRRGRLNPTALSRLASGLDDRVFRKKEVHTSRSVALSLVVDCSGSMKGHPLLTAMQAAYGLSSVLERLKVTHEVIGFTTNYESAGPDRATLAESVAKLGRNYSRYEPLYMPVFKGFHESLNGETRARFAGYGHRGMTRNNVDGECVQIAARRLMQCREERKIMIVLSDGEPSAYGNPHELSAHLKKSVRQIEASGIEVVGLGIMTDAPRKFYRQHMVLRGITELPTACMKQLAALLLK